MAMKFAVQNPNIPDLSALFSWGLRVRDLEELLFVAGHGDMDASFQVRHPGDPLAQARGVFEDLRVTLEAAGYGFADVVKVEATVTRAFDLETNFDPFMAVWGEFFAGSPVKPSGGTLRVIDGLAVPGMLVEIELLAAR